MAYSAANLTSLANGNGFTLWHYTTTDTIATVNTEGYFNDAAPVMNVGDIVEAYTSTGGTAVMSRCLVLSNTGTVVDVSDGVALTLTDSD
tara:strand:- start:1106 stop:1375 length:270 start_codon:yes stop_codon:yes gene_type:complete